MAPIKLVQVYQFRVDLYFLVYFLVFLSYFFSYSYYDKKHALHCKVFSVRVPGTTENPFPTYMTAAVVFIPTDAFQEEQIFTITFLVYIQI